MMNYKAYLQTKEWQIRRKAALKRAGYRCQVCNLNIGLEVHHNSYRNLGNEKPEDLIVLCDDCHEIFHKRLPKPPLWMRVKWWIEEIIR